MTGAEREAAGVPATDTPLLVIDTATRVALVALASADGRLVAEERWEAGYRHGEELLAHVDAILRHAGVALGGLGGVIVGTGPGAFTGLRVGIATAKGLAHAAELPIVGVGTGLALIDAAAPPVGGAVALLLPAGPSDRVLCRRDEAPRRLPGGEDPDPRPGELLVAVDLDGRAPDDATRIGERARNGLAGAMAAIGARRLAAGDADDLATLVPEYVTLPRGVRRDVPDDAVHVVGAG